jgi:hypothetical protein
MNLADFVRRSLGRQNTTAVLDARPVAATP